MAATVVSALASRWQVIVLVAVLVSGSASAQGLTGGLAGLREAFLYMWGFAGIVPAILLAVAFVREKKKPGSSLAYLLVLLAFLYALSAIPMIFIESNGFASKFVGIVGFAILFGVVRFFIRERRQLRNGVCGVLGLILAALLIIPNEYWKIPLLSLQRIVYVDNLSDFETAGVLRTPYGYLGRLALDDGRLLIQTQYVPERARYQGQSERTAWSNGTVVVLEPIASNKPGHWFEIKHYDRAYVSGVRHNGQRARYVWALSEKRVDTYRPSWTTLGYLVDESAGIDHEDLLIRMLREDFGSWSREPDRHDPGNKYHWAQELIAQGSIDLNSPAVLDRVFGGGTRAYALASLVQFGLSPVAQDSRGNTVLHFAAMQENTAHLQMLLEFEIEPSIENARGQTALDVVRERAKRDPRQLERVYRHFEELLTAQ